MADLDDIADLSEPEREIIALWVALLRQQAELSLHEDLLKKLLGIEERGEPLRDLYKSQLRKRWMMFWRACPTRIRRVHGILIKFSGGCHVADFRFRLLIHK
jgi:hypothetical protein